MMNYQCQDCGHIFEEGEQTYWTEPHGEQMVGCPLCHGTFEPATPCRICGASCLEDYCEECREDVKDRFQKFVDCAFTKEERELLNELYDGEMI